MTSMPETIWAYYDEAQENAGGRIWYPGDEPEWDIGESAIYRRADLPPTLAQAARTLLDADEAMPIAAKLAAISAHTAREGKARPVAIMEAWRAALAAIERLDRLAPDDGGG